MLLEIYKQYQEDWSTNYTTVLRHNLCRLHPVTTCFHYDARGLLSEKPFPPDPWSCWFAVVELLFDDCLDWLNWAHEHRSLPPLQLITQGSDNITGNSTKCLLITVCEFDLQDVAAQS